MFTFNSLGGGCHEKVGEGQAWGSATGLRKEALGNISEKSLWKGRSVGCFLPLPQLLFPDSIYLLLQESSASN